MHYGSGSGYGFGSGSSIKWIKWNAKVKKVKSK
jgi:hypothetical protein